MLVSFQAQVLPFCSPNLLICFRSTQDYCTANIYTWNHVKGQLIKKLVNQRKPIIIGCWDTLSWGVIPSKKSSPKSRNFLLIVKRGCCCHTKELKPVCLTKLSSGITWSQWAMQLNPLVFNIMYSHQVVLFSQCQIMGTANDLSWPLQCSINLNWSATH